MKRGPQAKTTHQVIAALLDSQSKGRDGLTEREVGREADISHPEVVLRDLEVRGVATRTSGRPARWRLAERALIVREGEFLSASEFAVRG